MTVPIRSSPKPEPTVVGIGASAGGLAALRTLFEHVPEASGLAFVVVMHLSPEHESHLAELLQPHVTMPVQQVTETVQLEPDRVYVIPPGRNLNTIDTHLRLSDLEAKRSERAPIDHFLRTLSQTHDGHSVGVILTGTGSDGTLGIREIKARGGLTVVQEPSEAEYDGMPQSALATGMVDLVLSLAAIPDAIVRFARTEPKVPIPSDNEIESDERHLLQTVFAQVRARTGRDFTRYKRPTVLRRIARRMQLRHVEELPAYLELLQENPKEVRALADDLLVTVTSFFRDSEVFEALERDVLPGLFRNRGPDDEVRVWSVGCATGEEAYSLAMLLLEEAARHDHPPRLQVFASDLHEHSLAKARHGFYPGDITVDVSEERLTRFFVKEDGGYRIRQEVRDRVVFAPHNLLGDPPFSRLDVVCCRNVLIYLQRDVQQDVIALFHYALRPEGTLVLGTAETLESEELFHTVAKEHRVYRKRNVPGSELHLPVFPLAYGRPSSAPPRAEPVGGPVAYGALHQRLVEAFAPPSILVGPDDRVVHLSENAGRYLRHPGGESTQNVLKLVRSELRMALRAALHAARQQKEATRSEPIPVQFDGSPSPVVLHVRPALASEQEDFALVIFEQETDVPAEGAGPRAEAVGAEARATESAAELDLTRQRLQALIERYEVNQEELRAGNEELQSANEELRSTMEELETSKEELQSTNEELQTVNQENRHKVEELAQLSGDLQNLLSSTDIATLFLDRSLRILRFTPQVNELFNVRSADRGRPLSDLTHRLGYDDLLADAAGVLERLVPVDREVRDEGGRWYLARVRPYRSAEDRIEGVVLTFLDITGRKSAEAALRESEVRFRAMAETVPDVLFTATTDGVVDYVSRQHEALTGAPASEAIGTRMWPGQIAPDDRARVQGAWDEAVEHDLRFEARYRMRNAKGDDVWVMARARHVHDEGALERWFGTVTEVDALVRAEQDLKALNETLEEQVGERTRQVRELARLLTRTEQGERHQIAQILHDDLQQLLYATEMKLRLLSRDLDGVGRPELVEKVDEARAWITQAVKTTRHLTVDLSPPILRHEGLADALAWLQRQMQELHDLEVVLEAEHSFVLEDEDLRVLLFQIVRELLFNVKKHAGVPRAVVRLVEEGDGLVISVSDEGRGFDPAAFGVEAETGVGFGLVSARERLDLLGGRLEMHSVPGEGTRAVVRAPMRAASA